MNTYLLLRYLHLLFLFIMVGSVIAQLFILQKEMDKSSIRRISKTDLVYGITSLLVVGIGLTLWFGAGKPAAFYTNNPLFLTKVGLFIAVGILSIYPTLFYRNQRKALGNTEKTRVPALVLFIVRLELLLLLIIPLLAVLMASGVGYTP